MIRIAARVVLSLSLVVGCHRRTPAGTSADRSLDASTGPAVSVLPPVSVAPLLSSPPPAGKKTQLDITILRAGNYGMGLSVKVDGKKKRIVGEYSNATGDDGHGHPMFKCNFSFRGIDSGTAEIPLEVNSGGTRFRGILRVLSETAIHVKFDVEPGGCWNVDPDISGHIAKEGTIFSIER